MLNAESMMFVLPCPCDVVDRTWSILYMRPVDHISLLSMSGEKSLITSSPWVSQNSTWPSYVTLYHLKLLRDADFAWLPYIFFHPSKIFYRIFPLVQTLFMHKLQFNHDRKLKNRRKSLYCKSILWNDGGRWVISVEGDECDTSRGREPHILFLIKPLSSLISVNQHF